jgi:hypothetical protein
MNKHRRGKQIEELKKPFDERKRQITINLTTAEPTDEQL